MHRFALLLLLSPLFLTTATPVQAAPPDSLLHRGVDLLDRGVNNGSVEVLQNARALFKQATGQTEQTALAHYYAALSDYRIAHQFNEEAEEKRERVLDDAIAHLEAATETAPKMADAWALLSACYGQMMGMNPWQGITLGPKSSNALSKAKELAPKNPRVWIVSGTQDFFTPAMFGGDKEAALRKFKKAARLAAQETVSAPLQPSWGHAEAHAWIGIAHMDAERYDQARRAFQRALDVNPNYGWVKAVLLPKLNEQTE